MNLALNKNQSTYECLLDFGLIGLKALAEINIRVVHITVGRETYRFS